MNFSCQEGRSRSLSQGFLRRLHNAEPSGVVGQGVCLELVVLLAFSWHDWGLVSLFESLVDFELRFYRDCGGFGAQMILDRFYCKVRDRGCLEKEFFFTYVRLWPFELSFWGLKFWGFGDSWLKLPYIIDRVGSKFEGFWGTQNFWFFLLFSLWESFVCLEREFDGNCWSSGLDGFKAKVGVFKNGLGVELGFAVLLEFEVFGCETGFGFVEEFCRVGKIKFFKLRLLDFWLLHLKHILTFQHPSIQLQRLKLLLLQSLHLHFLTRLHLPRMIGLTQFRALWLSQHQTLVWRHGLLLLSEQGLSNHIC